MSESLTRGELLKGTRLGPFEIVRLVGHGATASVFEAINVAIGRPVALKILHEHLAADERMSARFQREGTIAAQIRHPNAIDVTDVGASNGITYLVMELLDGEDLRRYLADEGPLTVAHALALLLPIAAALAHGHGFGVTHRDVKPANIVLARDARGNVTPKLVDFGLSKHIDDDAGLTSSDLVLGTAQYMAPEQTMGSKNSGPKSDQYSFAAVLYESITAQPPISAEGFYPLIEAIRAGVVRPPSMINAAIVEDLDGVVLRALNRNPEKRFADMRELGRALLPFADEETIRAHQRDFAEAPAGAAASPSRPMISAKPVVTKPAERPELAPLPCAAGASPFHIKGMPYRGIVHLVQSALPGGLDALCDLLDDATLRDFIRQPFLATGRYDVLPLVPLSATLAKVFGQSFEAFVTASATAQARYDARTVYKRLYDGAVVSDIPARVLRFEAQYSDYAEFEGWFDSPDLIILQNNGIPAYLYPWYASMHGAYTEAAVALIGSTAHGNELPPRPGRPRNGFPTVVARMELRWR